MRVPVLSCEKNFGSRVVTWTVASERFCVLDQGVPIDGDHALGFSTGSADDLDAVPQLVGREPAKTLFAKGEPAPPCPPQRRLLPGAVVMSWNQPDVANGLQSHPVAIVFDHDARIGAFHVCQDDSD